MNTGIDFKAAPDPTTLSRLDSFPRRIFLVDTALPIYDHLGFVQRFASDEIISAKNLTDTLATLVFAPPWTGKTFVAKQLYKALKHYPESPFGSYCQITFFEAGRNTEIVPSWWEPWLRGASHACWIIDAIDEDERRGDRQIYRILELVEQLSVVQRSRLHILFFARENEIPESFEAQLTDIFGNWSTRGDTGPRKLRLAGLDRESARYFLGASDFDRVCKTIEENRLQAVASLPAALEFLQRSDSTRHFTKVDVWEGVLKNLLRERRDLGHPSVEVEDEFEAVAWLAATLTFSGKRELEDVHSTRPMLEELVPRKHPQYQLLRGAARLAFQTAVFERSENGSRFAQDHVREWFTAFALIDLPLLRTRSLLVCQDGKPNVRHRGVIGILAQIAKASEVRDWIVESHGGVAPPSDAGPWSIEEASRALDALQMLARSSAWGLSFWRENERLNHFAVPGIGEELARRLDSSSSANEERLFLEIGQVVRAPQISEPAMRIVKQVDKDDRVRTLAAHLVVELGSEVQLRSLEEWLRNIPLEAHQHAGVITTLAAGFYEKGFWSFETAARLALQIAQTNRLDSTLQIALSNNISPDRARLLIDLTLATPESTSKGSIFSSYLVQRAIEALTAQKRPIDLDYEALAAFLLEEEALVSSARQNRGLREVFSQNAAARRALFLVGLKQDPTGKERGSWLWRQGLRGEDTEWLLAQIHSRNGEPAWLFDTLYWISYRQESKHLRNRARLHIRQHDENLLLHLDKAQKSIKRQQKKWQLSGGEELEKFDLPALISDALEAPSINLHQRMIQISQLCFASPIDRPTNVIGNLDSLPDELRDQAIAVCREALVRCVPTLIPDEQSFSSWILWEASCFSHMVAREPDYILSSDIINKWLPAVLRTHGPDWEVTLRRCRDVDPNLSENLVMDAIAREAALWPGSVYTLQQLPPDLWTEHLASRLEHEFIRSESTPVPTRIYLLDRLNRFYPAHAIPIAEEWAKYELDEQKELQYAGVDILLASSPAEGWRYLSAMLQQGDAAGVFSQMRSLQPNHYGPKADLKSWPAELLEQLTDHLFLAFPPKDDPVREVGVAYSLGGKDDLRSIRDYIPRLLLQRDLPEDRLALERLTQAHPRIMLWYRQELAERGAGGFLAQISSRTVILPGSEDYVPVEQVINALLDSRYRLLRSVADLHAVVLEHLKAIRNDAKRHLSMLYKPKPKKGEGERARLHEDALQAYVECRLLDRLGSGILERQPNIFLDREPFAARNTRNDLKVQAQAIDGKAVTLIIEIKWSDNPDVSTNLVTQLGQQYLKENQHSHGIYLVGWNGSPGPWKGIALGTAPNPLSSHAAWQKSLDEQARLFLQENPDIQITPFVIDLTWEPPVN